MITPTERIVTLVIKEASKQAPRGDYPADWKWVTTSAFFQSQKPTVIFVPMEEGDVDPGQIVTAMLRTDGLKDDPSNPGQKYDGHLPWMYSWRYIRRAEEGEQQPLPAREEPPADSPAGRLKERATELQDKPMTPEEAATSEGTEWGKPEFARRIEGADDDPLGMPHLHPNADKWGGAGHIYGEWHTSRRTALMVAEKRARYVEHFDVLAAAQDYFEWLRGVEAALGDAPADEEASE